MENYNIFAQLKSEIDSFDNDTITIAEGEQKGTRYLGEDTSGYSFSQKRMLNLIDLYDGSKFERGNIDREGQQKLFLNICAFRRKVASKQIRLGVKDYTFIPDDYNSIWKVWFMARQFKVWARENNLGELINECEENFPKYGSIVNKRVGKKVERVPLKNLKNTQDAKSLKEAALTGGYVIEEHDYTQYEMKKFKDWKVKDLDLALGKKLKVHERYALVPRWVIDDYEGTKTEDETPVLAFAVLAPDKESKDIKGKILYLQQIPEDDFPYEEEHWDKIDGRWLGVGEIENQIENQIARNVSANLRRRAMLWSSKKVFQSVDEAINRNLVKDVKDGEVLHIAPNGNITQVDLGTRALADFNANDAMWEDNSNQKSFTFEVATGETMPSGTPFRLGVLLTNAVSTHFERMKEKFALFLIRSYFNQLIPIFKKETKEHNVMVAGSEEGIQHLLEAIKSYYVWQEFKNQLLAGRIPVLGEVQAEADKFVNKQRYHSVEIPDRFYDDVKFHMELEITGQAIDTKQEMETMTNIFMTVSRNPAVLQDKNMLRLLEMIVSRTGKTLKDFMGEVKMAAPQMGGQQINANVNQTRGATLPQVVPGV